MGPPYAPAFQGLGSPPTVIPDVPVSAVFLVLFLITGAIHMTLLQVNKKHGHKFMFSGAMFGEPLSFLMPLNSRSLSS